MAFLSVKQVADRLGMSERFVYTRVGTGEIKSVRFGDQIRISEEALNEYVAQSAVTQ